MKNLKTLLLLFLAIPLFICCEKDEPQNGEGGDSEPETEIVKECVEQDGLLFDGILYYEIINQIEATVYCVEEDLCVGDIEIPHKIKLGEDVFTVTHIGEFAFDGCEELLNIKIPNSITYIGEEAFETCTGLIEIIIPNSVSYIGEEAFAGCDGLSRFVCLATTPPTIHEDTFDEVSCPLYVPNNCISAYNSAKYWNDFDDIFDWDEFVPDVGDKFVYDGFRFEITMKAKEIAVVRNGYQYSGDIVIPESVIYNGVKYSVTSIDSNVFESCENLTSVDIPNSVISIGWKAFNDCTGLTSLDISNSITEINGYAFSGCYRLTTIEIPNSVTYIGRGAFSACYGLTSILVDNENTKYDSRNGCNSIIETASNTLIVGCQNTIIPNSVTNIEFGAFMGCHGLTSIEIPNSVTTIGESAFYGCVGLTSIEIPNSVNSIGDDAFSLCRGLTSVVIGNSVTSIGKRVFDCCYRIIEINCKPITPPNIDSNSFCDFNATMNVPKGALSNYKNHPIWGKFININEVNF